MKKYKTEIIGILLLLTGILTLVSLLTFDPTEEPTISSSITVYNSMGILGVYISHYLIKLTFGWGTLVIPFLIGWFGVVVFTGKKIRPFSRHVLYWAGAGMLAGVVIAATRLLFSPDVLDYTYSGLLGGLVARFLRDFTGAVGMVGILLAGVIILISAYLRWSVFGSLKNIGAVFASVFRYFKNIIPKLPTRVRKDQRTKSTSKVEKNISDKSDQIRKQNVSDEEKPELHIPDNKSVKPTVAEAGDHKSGTSGGTQTAQKNEVTDEIKIDEMDTIIEGDADRGKTGLLKYKQYKLPSVDLLSEPPEVISTISEEVLHQRAEQLKHALDTFKVAGKIVRISPGPVITLYEIEPAEGVRVNKFTNLADDLARIMRAERIRVIAPIPGSKTVGIELPNDNPAIVALRSIISSEKFIKSESKLTLAMGKTTKGDAFVSDLAKMPHLLIAGATGSGKSICINTIIMSILYKAKPDEVKFIMIDPKKLELFTYKSLVGYHLITSANIDEYVMTSPENAVGILNSALSEMERRYTLFANSTVRSISEYHAKAEKHPDMENIPFIVVVIDELADLMLTAGRDVEEPITRLAQMARAVGIHLVVATQRPSVDVITGLIKANFPARIAFQVSQKVDSRTIIDQMGAEKLLGRGDMLFLPPGTSEPFRMHNAYISTSEIEAIMEHIASQPKSEEVMLPEIKDKSVSTEFSLDEDSDELLMEAAKLVIEQGQASVSALQRRFRIGYSRAGRLIDELEALGVVSGYSGSKAREVLVDSSYLDDLMK